MKKSLKKHLKELKELDKKKMEDSKEEDGCVTPRDNILTNEDIITDSIKDLNINYDIEDKNVIELANVKEYGLTINGSSFNTNIDIMDLIKCGKCLEMDKDNLREIPNLPGNYWIATNEPILHSLNPDFNHRPKKIEYKGNELNIIYNGQGDTIQTRINSHLYRPKTKGLSDMSGISIDITDLYEQGTHISHNKCLYMKKSSGKGKKLPYYETLKRNINYNDIKEVYSEDDLDNIKEYCKNLNEESTIYLKNGININEDKHKKYIWLVIYYDMNKLIYHPFSDIIEQKWRKINGSPILCSYKCGR